MGVCTRESMAQSRVKGRQPGIEYETISILTHHSILFGDRKLTKSQKNSRGYIFYAERMIYNLTQHLIKKMGIWEKKINTLRAFQCSVSCIYTTLKLAKQI